jgi:hypothetical protein
MDKSPEVRMATAAVLTWLLPGAGHLFVRERARGLILLVTITLTFWMGVAVGGLKNTVNPADRSLWFMGQICAGGHALAAWGLSGLINAGPDKDPKFYAYGRSEEIAVVYTCICGMLNILIILDVLVRAEKPLTAVPLRGPPAARRGSSA